MPCGDYPAILRFLRIILVNAVMHGAIDFETEGRTPDSLQGIDQMPGKYRMSLLAGISQYPGFIAVLLAQYLGDFSTSLTGVLNSGIDAT